MESCSIAAHNAALHIETKAAKLCFCIFYKQHIPNIDSCTLMCMHSILKAHNPICKVEFITWGINCNL